MLPELPPLPECFMHTRDQYNPEWHTPKPLFTADAMRSYGEACARAALRAAWIAAGGYEHSVPKHSDFAIASRSVLALVREVEEVAATVSNPLAALMNRSGGGGGGYEGPSGTSAISGGGGGPVKEPDAALRKRKQWPPLDGSGGGYWFTLERP